MNRKTVLWALLDLVFLVVFNIVFFVLGGTKHETSVWIAYGFIHFAYAMLLITPFITRRSSASSVLGFPLYSVSSIYFIICFLVGLVVFVAHPAAYKAVMIIYIVLTGIYAVALISNLLANESTADSIERHEIELRYIKDASIKLKRIMERTEDKKTYKKVEQLYDLIHSSPAKSNGSVRRYELAVLQLIDTLEDDFDRNDMVAATMTMDEIKQNASERNRRLIVR